MRDRTGGTKQHLPARLSWLQRQVWFAKSRRTRSTAQGKHDSAPRAAFGCSTHAPGTSPPTPPKEGRNDKCPTKGPRARQYLLLQQPLLFQSLFQTQPNPLSLLLWNHKLLCAKINILAPSRVATVKSTKGKQLGRARACNFLHQDMQSRTETGPEAGGEGLPFAHSSNLSL